MTQRLYTNGSGARYVAVLDADGTVCGADLPVTPEEVMGLADGWYTDQWTVLPSTAKTYTKALSLEETPAILRLAERLDPELHKAFLAAVAKLKSAINLNALAAAIIENQLTAAEAAVRLSTFPEVFGELAGPLRSAFLVGSGLVMRELAQSGLSTSFTLVNPAAVQYAKTQLIEIVQPFKDDAKDLIRTFVAKAVSGETTPKGAAKDIRDLIGLDPRRVQRADTFWRTLLEQDVPEPVIQRRVGRFMEALLRERADVIARTEIHRAAAYGQLEAWRQAAQSGLFIKSEYVKVWVVTEDERLCSLCEPMDGVAVELDEPFDRDSTGQKIQNVFGEVMDIPDMHPNCRCTMNLVRKDQVEEGS